ncbi:MAG: AbrB/MazE/SpoVT family DNA-binding domain-containing protein [Armatimonadetes bacterium]|nr:AbrB/MazE/SpoVT family DNA-binding domain-containing protein [Armatimonadota bacterium]
MVSVRVSSKYQVSIPSSVRKKLQIEPGQELQVEVTEDGIYLLPVPTLEDIRGIAPGLTYKGVREKEDRI